MVGKPRGRVPRDRSTASECVVTVRMSGALHARLNAQRAVRSKSMNQLILDCLYDSLPIAAQSAPLDAAQEAAQADPKPESVPESEVA
jgi:hypothetical protein